MDSKITASNNPLITKSKQITAMVARSSISTSQSSEIAKFHSIAKMAKGDGGVDAALLPFLKHVKKEPDAILIISTAIRFLIRTADSVESGDGTSLEDCSLAGHCQAEAGRNHTNRVRGVVVGCLKALKGDDRPAARRACETLMLGIVAREISAERDPQPIEPTALSVIGFRRLAGLDR